MPIFPPSKPNGKNPKKKGFFGFSLFWMYAFVGLFLIGIFYLDDNSITKEVPLNTFEQYIDAKGITKIEVIRDKFQATGYLTDSLAAKLFPAQFKPGQNVEAKVVTTYSSVDKFDSLIDAWRAEGKFNGDVVYEKSSSITQFFWYFGPILILVAFWLFMMRRMGSGGSGGGIFSVGKSKAKVFDKDNDEKVTFKDVAGLSEAKTEIEEIVEFLRNPKRYTDLGGKIPKGALLVGPPGTGKTLLAKAVAGEANVPFFSMSGSDFVEMFVGVGASRVRDLFRQAKEKAPCIVFIDEIDAVGRARGHNPNMGSNDERENTLNQLLTEMDGFGTNSGVIILAATNRVDILDKALLRAGRFDRQIYVDLPDVNDRKEIFKVHLRKIKTAADLDLDFLSRQTAGFSGADIANVCNEAALIAARHNKTEVTVQDFNDAIDRIIGGLEKKNKITTADEKRGIAVHEAGHATVSWHLEYGDPLVKVTIVPRGKALGAAWYLPEERQIIPAQAILDKICGLMAGRAAEDIVLGRVATGALNDLERATKLAYSLVVYYGMSDKLPNISYYNADQDGFGLTKPYSEERARVIDEEVSNILSTQYQRAKDIINEYRQGLDELANMLYEREVIFTADVQTIFGPRKWASRQEEIKALNEAKELTPPKFEEPDSATEDKDEHKPESDEPQDDTPDADNDIAETDTESQSTDETQPDSNQ